MFTGILSSALGMFCLNPKTVVDNQARRRLGRGRRGVTGPSLTPVKDPWDFSGH